NDPVGWDRVKDIARELRVKAASVRTVELPGAPEKGDVTDWLEAHGWTPALVGDWSPRAWALKGRLREALEALLPNTQQDNASAEPLGATQRDNGTGDPLGTHPTGQRDAQQDGRGEPLSCWVLGALGGPVEPFPVEVFPQRLQRFILSAAAA